VQRWEAMGTDRVARRQAGRRAGGQAGQGTALFDSTHLLLPGPTPARLSRAKSTASATKRRTIASSPLWVAS
jgi:hypothetical protein